MAANVVIIIIIMEGMKEENKQLHTSVHTGRATWLLLFWQNQKWKTKEKNFVTFHFLPLSPSLPLSPPPFLAAGGGVSRVRMLPGCRGFILSFLVETVVGDVCVCDWRVWGCVSVCVILTAERIYDHRTEERKRGGEGGEGGQKCWRVDVD